MTTNEKEILAYLNGQLTSEEVLEFEKELQHSDALKREVEDYRFILRQTSLLKAQNQYSTQKKWEELEMRIGREKRWNGVRKFMRNAAAILVLPLLMVTLYLWTGKGDKKQPLVAEWVEVTSARGVISKVILPDSTVVWLNSASTLRYPHEFGEGRRTVDLRGEAYFRVKADKEHRFDVNVPEGLTISAYGTEFNVSSYENSPTVEAVLTRGNVEILLNNHALAHLQVSEQAVLNKARNSLEVLPCNVEEATAWREGKLIFRRAGIEEILYKLARRYNVDFEVSGRKISNYEFSATFTDESLEEILSILERTAPMSYTIFAAKEMEDFTYQRRKVSLKLR
ncbi:FecR domain-containing protein [Bacteroides helcogenes]|uniref:Anti-FecI sigma factor, FecR n=1 Tax=Bacteroides helcogenes (strain ATCC 35417 / DSM 20613 / JCM 6297 / CCUG 15421 / P 36-108) TaxID=693979 RepID=E6SRX4_BACT6|nr:FecR domain-containing protein [Bacteroides helcogenes]ADV42133.1 anti-FecI sigma factor, FecR [Bacteroides helcogenes P 36-108]MDY5240080.1 DUF4974 domain-containing protein [Bacteroides helcogenes]